MAKTRPLLNEIKSRLLDLMELDQRDLLTIETCDNMAKEIIEKTDEYLTLLTPGTVEHDQALMLRGFTQVQQISWHRYFNPTPKRFAQSYKELKQLLEVVEPMGNKVNGYLLYFETLMTMMFNCKSRWDMKNCHLYAKKMEEAHKRYLATNTEIPTHRESLLDYGKFSKEDFDMMEHQIGYLTRQAYEYNPELLEPKYAAQSIKWMIYLANRDYDGTMPQILHMFQPLEQILDYFFKRREFKQLDHLLAIVMAFFVKYRRTLGKIYKLKLDAGQGMIAQVYARWGKEMLEASLAELQGKEYKVVNNETFIAINNPDDVEYKVYSGQFPVEPIEDKDEIKKIFKRTKAWNKRAKELSFMYSGGINIELYLNLAKLTMKRLFATDTEVEEKQESDND